MGFPTKHDHFGVFWGYHFGIFSVFRLDFFQFAKDPFVSPKVSGWAPYNPMTWGWDWNPQSYSRDFFLNSHRIHVTGIFTYIWWMFMVNVGVYIYIYHTWMVWELNPTPQKN